MQHFNFVAPLLAKAESTSEHTPESTPETSPNPTPDELPPGAYQGRVIPIHQINDTDNFSSAPLLPCGLFVSNLK